MRKITLGLLILALSLSACNANSTAEQDLNPKVSAESQVSDSAQPIEVTAGSEFHLILEANPTTGYHWELAKEPDAGVVEFISRDYKADTPITTGSGGVDIWTFKTVSAGETHITLGYYPPSFEPEEPQQTVTFTVTVK